MKPIAIAILIPFLYSCVSQDKNLRGPASIPISIEDKPICYPPLSWVTLNKSKASGRLLSSQGVRKIVDFGENFNREKILIRFSKTPVHLVAGQPVAMKYHGLLDPENDVRIVGESGIHEADCSLGREPRVYLEPTRSSSSMVDIVEADMVVEEDYTIKEISYFASKKNVIGSLTSLGDFEIQLTPRDSSSANPNLALTCHTTYSKVQAPAGPKSLNDYLIVMHHLLDLCVTNTGDEGSQKK